MKVRLLLLEDNPSDAELTLSALSEAGFTLDADCVVDEQEFREALLSRDYDAILADHALPQFDGISALHIAQEISPATPFLFVSGTMGEELAIDALHPVPAAWRCPERRATNARR